MISTRSLQFTFALVFITALFCLVDYPTQQGSPLATTSPGSTSASESLRLQSPEAEQTKPSRRRHVAIATAFPYHAEVYGALAWAFNRYFHSEKQAGPNSVRIYAEDTEFVSLIMKLGLLPGSIMHPAGAEGLIADVRSTILFPDDPGAMIDVVALGTCEFDLWGLGADLLQAWDERPIDKKFMLVCGTHNGKDAVWQPKNLAEWSKRGALRLLTISDHVSRHFKTRLEEWSDSKDPDQRLSFFEYVKVDAFYPVSDFTNFPLPDKSGGPKVPCTGLLQGGFEKSRRDYDRIFFDLVRLLREDPTGWGYRWSDAERKYLPDASAPNPPFVLHLLGWSRQLLEIPQELERVVVKDVDLSMDIVIPGFSPDGGYLTRQASSTIHTALENRIPILVTRAILEAYPHVPGVPSIVRPASLSEMEAIGLLRGANINAENPSIYFKDLGYLATSGKHNCVGPAEFCEDVRAMLQQGWKRTQTQWNQHLESVWKRNEITIGRILRDI
ncbi:hypothetical protein FRC00_001759 [Tulasnella sp. 408]|nr:hypothetical protein FRC00_001759 [Tulasnella sp. 408]